MFRSVLKRFYSNLKSFDNLEELNHYLAANKFAHTLVYFRANWNPNCTLTDQHINKLASEQNALQIIKVDSDVAHKIARHYSVKAEPEFVFCLYGDEVIRQIGPNFDGLVDKFNKMVKLGQQTDLSVGSAKWIPYGSRYQAYYEEKLKHHYAAHTS